MLCKTCSHKGKDYLAGKRCGEYTKKMSEAKIGCSVWNAGKTDIYSEDTIEKMRQARINQNPCGDMISVDQRRIKRRCLVYLARQIRRWVNSKTTSQYCVKLFDFTFGEFIVKFESQFQLGMSWDNYGEWHIDHIIPDSAYQYSSIKDVGFKKSWNLNNLQPLWAKENLKKGNRYKG